MNWGQFSFGTPNTVQRDLYENQPATAYQQFMDYFGQGQAGFENTVFGRWLNSQQTPLYNHFKSQAAANPSGNLTWMNFLEGQANQGGQNNDLMNQYKNLPAYMRGSNSGAMQVRRELW